MPVQFHNLSFVDDGADTLVGRVDTETFVLLPGDGAALLAHLMAGMPTDAAAAWYEVNYGEPVDIDDFIASLDELGFVRSDEEQAPIAELPRVRKQIANAVFSIPVAVLFVALMIWWLATLNHHHDLLPQPRQIFFTSSLVIIQLVITGFQIPLIFLHEGSHVLAGWRLGLFSRLGVSNRLTNIVFESRMNGLLSVPRRRRYLPFLSGMLCDLAVWAALDVLAELTRAPDGSLTLVGRIALTLAFTTVLRLAWQFQLYLRTDLYYVTATLLNCHDLHAASVTILRNRLWRAIGQHGRVVPDESKWSARDRQIGQWYGPVIALGILFFFAIAIWSSIPICVHYVHIIIDRFQSGSYDSAFWDSVLSLSMNIANLVALRWLAVRKRNAALSPKLAPAQGV